MLDILLGYDPILLLAFIGAGLVLNLTRGVDFAFVSASGIQGGPRIGMAAAVGISPRKAIIARVCVSGMTGGPSMAQAVGRMMTLPMTSRIAARPTGSTGGRRRVRIELTA